MNKVREFKEAIETNSLEEFGGFKVNPYNFLGSKGYEVSTSREVSDAIISVKRVVSFDEINSAIFTGVDFAKILMDTMNEELDHFELPSGEKHVTIE